MPTNSQTTTNLADRVRLWTNLRGSGFVTDAEILNIINASFARLHDLMVLANKDYFSTAQTITIVSGTDAYNLDSAFYKELFVKVLYNGDRFRLKQFPKEDDGGAVVDYYSDAIAAPILALRWRIVGDQIIFRGPDGFSAPTQAGTAYLYYARAFVRLTTGQTPAVPEGWEEYVVLDAAIAIREMRALDISFLERQRDREEERITRMAGFRVTSEPIGMVRRR